jgi:hypothetical protein
MTSILFLYYEVEVFVSGGDIICKIQEYLHRFWTIFEHEFNFGGGSGHSGGIISISSLLSRTEAKSKGQTNVDLINYVELLNL